MTKGPSRALSTLTWTHSSDYKGDLYVGLAGPQAHIANLAFGLSAPGKVQKESVEKVSEGLRVAAAHP